MKLYKRCSTLPIYYFFRIFDTNDYRNLIIGFDEDNDELELTNEQNFELESIFNDLIFEYTDLTSNFKAKSTIRKQILIKQWEITYDIVINCVNLYFESKATEYLSFLKDVGYEVDLEKDIKPQLSVISKKMKGLKNKIKIYKINLAKSFEEDKKQVKADLDKEALYLEKNLDLKREIDIKTTSVTKWVKLIELSKTKSTTNGTV